MPMIELTKRELDILVGILEEPTMLNSVEEDELLEKLEKSRGHETCQ